MLFVWSLKFDDPRYGDNPRVVIADAASEAEAAYQCIVAVNIIDRATPNAG